MVIYTGKDFQLNRAWYDAAVPEWKFATLGGIVEPCEPFVAAEIVSEIGTATRRLALFKPAQVIGQIMPTIILQKNKSFLTDYGFISGEAAVPDIKDELVWTNGAEMRALKYAKVARAEVSVRLREPVRASLTILGKLGDPSTTPTWASQDPEEPMAFDSVDTLTLGGTDIKPYFKETTFGVDNNIEAEYAGTDLEFDALIDREARYTANLLVTKSIPGWLEEVQAGTKQTLVIALKDNQSPTPVTETFTFTDMIVREARIIKRGLGAIYERITLEGNQLTIT